jgi:hypothetical protein
MKTRTYSPGTAIPGNAAALPGHAKTHTPPLSVIR